MKFRQHRNSFLAGIVSDEIERREDIEKIGQGLTVGENFLLTNVGGKYRRDTTLNPVDEGDYFVGEYKFKLSPEKTFQVKLRINALDGYANIFAKEATDRSFTGYPVNTTYKTSDFIQVFDSDGEQKPVFSDTLRNYSPYSPADFDIQIDGHRYVYSFSVSDSAETPADLLYTNYKGYHTVQNGNKLLFCHKDEHPFVLELVYERGNKVAGISGLVLSDKDLGDYHFRVYPFCFDSTYSVPSDSPSVDVGAFGQYGFYTFPVESIGINTSIAIPPSVAFSATGGFMTFTTTVAFDELYYKPEEYVPFRVRTTFDSDLELILTPTKVTSTVLASGNIGYIATGICSNIITAGTYLVNTIYKSEWSRARGFPRAVTNFKGKVVFGGTGFYPNKFWVSASVPSAPSWQIMARMLAQFEGLQQETNPDSAGTPVVTINYAIPDDGYYDNVNNLRASAFGAVFNEADSGIINWLYGKKKLHVGTTSGEHQIRSVDGYFGFGSLETLRVSSFYIDNIQPIEADGRVFYVSDRGTTLRYLLTENNDYDSEDFEGSILYRGFTSLTHFEYSHTHKCLYILDSDQLKTITVNKELQVIAVMEHAFDIVDSVADTLTICPFEANERLFLTFIVGTSRVTVFSDMTRPKENKIINPVYGDFGTFYSNYITPLPTYFWDKEVIVESLDLTDEDTYYTTVDSSGILDRIPLSSTVRVYIPFKSKSVTTNINAGRRAYESDVASIRKIHEVQLDAAGEGKVKVGIEGSKRLETKQLTTTFDIHKINVASNTANIRRVQIETADEKYVFIAGVITIGESQEQS